MVAAAAIALVAALAVVLWSIVRAVLHSPRMLSRAMRDRRRARAALAISRGLIAIGAGDTGAARKFATQAGHLAPSEPLALLLSAQTAQLTGDRPAAGDATGVVVERHMADNFGLNPGDTFEVRTPAGWQTLTVTGIGASPEYVWPARSRQEVFTMPDQFGVAFGAPSLLQALPAQLATSQVLVTTTGPADDAGTLARLADAALAAGAANDFLQAGFAAVCARADREDRVAS